MDAYEHVVLGEVARLDVERVVVDANDCYPMAGLLIAGRGLFWRGEVWGSQTSYSALHRLRAGQLVMRKLTAWEGPITTVPASFDGALLSTEFPTFTLDEERLLPEYMRLICQRPAFHAEMKRRSRGTAERRKRLNPDGLLSIPIRLPPLDVQQRVVRTIALVDRAIAAYEKEEETARSLLHAARACALDGLETRRLDALVTDIQAGKSPRALDRAPSAGERAVLKVSAIRSGEFRPAEAKAVEPDVEFPAHAAVKEGDVLIGRANTRSLVGAACRVREVPDGLYLSDKTLRLVVDADVADPEYVVQAMSSSPARTYLEANATGTSESMKNVSQAVIRATPVPFIDDVEQQRRIGLQLRRLAEVAATASALRDATSTMREVLLENLAAGRAAPPVLTDLET